MNTVSYHPHSGIEAHQDPDDARTHTLPRHFGGHMLAFEDAIYRWERPSVRERLEMPASPQYRGARSLPASRYCFVSRLTATRGS